MHSIQQQFTYKYSLYARGFGGGADGAVGRTLFAGEPITIIEHETHANGSRPLDSGAGHRLLVTRRGAALLRRRSELGGALAAEPLQSLVLERGVAYALEAGDAGHAFTLFAFTGAASSTVSPRVEPEVADGAPALSALLDMHLLMGFHRLRRTLGAGGADHDRSTAVELEALALLSGVCERYRRRLISSPRI
ncbi:MAG TPA: hypothetical protein VJW73_16605, partial [Gemmatimonadaceae bacterium]|nr:hypothetical protein [Gemmatimonadaceae bacterium]